MDAQTIAVAMSGGVDSSTVAALMCAQGHKVVGLTMQLWNQRRLAGHPGMPEQVQGRCCSLDDVYDARQVAQHLGIPYYVVNFEQRFEEQVVKPFIGEYLAGRTPIPCTLCNNFIKFDQFLEMADAVGAHQIATGHYARITCDANGRFELRKALDRAKDQSYFLFELSQEQLRDALFPLGEMTKPEVRDVAERGGLAVARKKESYEICFVPQRDGYAAIVEREAGIAAGAEAGEIVDVDGNVVGRHDGYYHFTIGQRRGLQIGGTPERTYVVDVNPFTRRVTVGPASALERDELIAERVHWISGDAPLQPVEVQARVRSRSADVAANVTPLPDGRARVQFAQKLRGVAPGQAVVFYDDDLCLGGGWIAVSPRA